MIASQIIDALGGDVIVGRAAGVSRNAVYHWRTRGLPEPHALALHTLAKQRRVKLSLETILRAAPDRSKPDDPSRRSQSSRSAA